MPQFWITTEDNPYDPSTQWDQWYSFDEDAGYCTCGYIDRIALTSPDLSDALNVEAINKAIDEILEINVTGNYKRVQLNKK